MNILRLKGALLVFILIFESSSVSNALSAVVCESSYLNLKCSQNQLIKIQKALYGRLSANICTQFPNILNTSCSSSNSDFIVKNLCDSQNSCSIYAKNSIFQDPCVGTFKYLLVDYICSGPFKNLTKTLASISSTLKSRTTTYITYPESKNETIKSSFKDACDQNTDCESNLNCYYQVCNCYNETDYMFWSKIEKICKSCSNKGTEYTPECYIDFGYETNFQNARSLCKQMNSDLVVVHDKNNFHLLQNLISNSNHWIGAYFNKNTNGLYFLDETLIPSDWLRFNDQINNQTNAITARQECVSINQNFLTNNSCEQNLNFICELGVSYG